MLLAAAVHGTNNFFSACGGACQAPGLHSERSVAHTWHHVSTKTCATIVAASESDSSAVFLQTLALSALEVDSHSELFRFR